MNCYRCLLKCINSKKNKNFDENQKPSLVKKKEIVDKKKDNILISEDDYIYNLNKNSIDKKYNYYKTKYLIVYKFYKNTNKNFDNIIICNNDNNLYTIPNSPYMFYNKMYEPDGYYSNIKNKEFIDKINNLSTCDLKKRVKEKRVKFINLINKLNKNI